MLMGWGPFRFTVPTYSVEELSRHATGRVQPVPVVGTKSPTHILGTDPVRIDLQSTFHPRHYNKAGMIQLVGVRAAIEQQTPFILLAISGIIFGSFIGVDVQEGQSEFDASSTPETVTVTLSLMEYVSQSFGSRSARIGTLFR